jgi:UDP-GlcNAc:undecaprenyl-phosphate/decaprenyl-phosphate GlcNAc-1-phosphate transferase
MRAYALVGSAAFGAVVLLTPLTRWLSFAVGAIDQPGPRRVHTRPTGRLGGLAILGGIAAAMGVGAAMPAFAPVFETSEPQAVLVAALVIAAVGLADDVRGLPAPIKLTGQLAGAGVLTLFGLLLRFVYIPGDPGTLLFLTPDLSALLTIFGIVVMINAVNLTDGLDGLAAGMVAIAALALLAWIELAEATRLDTPTVAPLLLAAIVGACVGFLVYNRPPASIFMGDTGAMLLGLLLGAASVSALGPLVTPSRSAFAAASVPVLIPALVLALPMVDTIWAVIRRFGSREGLFSPDKRHLHHRLLAIGHSVRGAVGIMYYCSALLAFGAVAVSVFPAPRVAAFMVAGAVPVAALVVWPRRGADSPETDTSAAPAQGVPDGDPES